MRLLLALSVLCSLLIGDAAQAANPVPVLPPESADSAIALIQDVGYAVELPGGLHFDLIDIQRDTITYSLRRVADGEDGQALGTLVLSPRTEGPPPPTRSVSFDVTTATASTDPLALRHLAAAEASVLSHDAGGIYVRVGAAGPPGSLHPGAVTGSGDAGSAMVELVSGSDQNAASMRGQLILPGIVLFLLAAATALARWRRARPFSFSRRFSPTHLLPVMIQVSVYAYWALYWDGVGRHMPILLAQLVFAFAFDPLWSLATRHRWTATFSPLPVVLSANLFVWFAGSDMWLAFLVIAVALMSKSLVRPDGRHVFNPSAIGLAAAGALCLCLPRWFGYVDIAHQLALPPNMIEVIVLAVLVAQLRVPIVLVSIGAAITLVGLEPITGWQLLSPFYPAVLIIILALATDPATIPRTGGGRLFYGLFVGAGIHFAGIALTIAVGMDYWAKVLPIPIANALAPIFDRWGRALPKRLDELLSAHRNPSHMLAWAAVVAWGLFVIDVKPGIFDPDAHGGYATRTIVRDEHGAITCEANPAFCRPLRFDLEVAAWRSTRSPEP